MKTGRPRKAELNQVVNLFGSFGVVVDYDPDREWGKYRVVRTDPIGRFAYGMPIWVHSTEFEAMPTFSKRPGITYRANRKLEPHRECECQCCPHIRGFADEPVE
jgi:hypothetical protein